MTAPETFAAPVLRFEDGMRMHYVPLPHDLADRLDAAGARRVVGTLNGRPISRGVQRTGGGVRFLLFGRAALREMGLAYGDTAVLEIAPDPAPDAVDLGPELEAALDEDPEAARRFAAFTPGRRRSLVYYVTSAKRPATRQKRAAELAYKLRTFTLYGDLNPDKR